MDRLALSFQAQAALALSRSADPKEGNCASLRQTSLNVRHGCFYTTTYVERNTTQCGCNALHGECNAARAVADKYIMESDRGRSTYANQVRLRARRATEELKSALGRRGTSALKSRLLSCGKATQFKNVVSCGAVACAKCRERYVVRQVSALQEAFGEASNSEMAFVTVVLEITGWVEDIGEIFLRSRRKVRNIIDKKRRQSRAWADLQIVGWLEVDAFDPERFVDLPPRKKAQAEAMGLPPYRGTTPTWVVTFHAIASLGSVERQELARELGRHWSAPDQVHVQPFHENKSISNNINSLVRYCLKHENSTATTVSSAEPWEMAWRVEFYEYLNRWSKGFQSMRMWIKPRRDSMGESRSDYDDEHYGCKYQECTTPTDVYVDPMPLTF